MSSLTLIVQEMTPFDGSMQTDDELRLFELRIELALPLKSSLKVSPLYTLGRNSYPLDSLAP